MDILYQCRPSPVYAFFKAFHYGILALLLLLLRALIEDAMVLLSFLIILVACYRYFGIWCTRYVLTTQTLKITTGIFSKKTNQTELFRIRDYVITQPFWMRWFRLMTVTLYTTDHTDHVIKLTAIPVSDITEVMRELVKKARLDNHVVEISTEKFANN